MAYVHEDQTRFKTFSRRALLLAGGQTALMASLIGRMYYLQVVEGERYRTLAEDNRINIRLLAPPRGRIVDRFGTALADNQANFQVVVVPEQTSDLGRTLDDLSRIIEVSEEDRARILKEVRRRRPFVPVTVLDNLSWHDVSRLEVNAPALPGVAIEMGQTRRYPFGEPMTQILGYVAAVAEHELSGDPLLELPGFRIGKTGMERRFDDELRGTAGTSQVEVNAVGRVIRELSRDEGKPGRELVLSVDAGLQNFVHQRLLGVRSASAVVMNVHSGEVLALSSAPSYDASAFNIGLSSRQWQELANDPLGPLNNKAIGGTYAPGSTFKMVVALAAMEAGVSPGHKVFCPGFMELGRSRFHCWKRHGHGWLGMHDGIKHLRRLFLRHRAARRHRPHLRDGRAPGPRRGNRHRAARRARRGDPHSRLEASGHRRALAGRRDSGDRHRPRLRADHAAAAGGQTPWRRAKKRRPARRPPPVTWPRSPPRASRRWGYPRRI
jgi:penicillin-binding protein 2